VVRNRPYRCNPERVEYSISPTGNLNG